MQDCLLRCSEDLAAEKGCVARGVGGCKGRLIFRSAAGWLLHFILSLFHTLPLPSHPLPFTHIHTPESDTPLTPSHSHTPTHLNPNHRSCST